MLAFVGGTGVGKSTLLNALAGETVSPASVRRPTTSQPVAWVPADEREALGPLLEWLGVQDVREHGANDLGPVAILDLPDMDSVASEHRARVEAILPRVDAVAWVTDPEKYHDAALHDDFLLAWLPRLARQVVIVNKADRLDAEDGRRIRNDLETDLAASRSASGSQVDVLLTSAAPTPDIGGLQRWLSDGVAAKAIVRGRVAATVVDLVHRLAREAGIDPRGPATPFLDASRDRRRSRRPRPRSCARSTCPGWNVRPRRRHEHGLAPAAPGRWGASPPLCTGRPAVRRRSPILTATSFAGVTVVP